MAEVSESLTYRFQSENLDKLRRDMARLSDDVEDLGDEFTQLGGEAEGGTEAAEEAVQDLKRTVARIDFDELGDEAMDAADEVALAASVMEEELEGVQEKLNDISTLAARRQMRRLGQEVENVMMKAQALDAQDVDIDADVDRDVDRGSSFGGRGRLPGELDEVQESFMALSAVPPQLKALGAAGATAAAALGAGAGLAGVATKLAAELGPQGLQSDVQGARATFKETGREFASAFSGVIRSEVLPAVRGLAGAIQTVDDDLATFSGAMIDLLKNIQGVGPLIGAVVGAGRAAGESQSNADALAQGIGDVPGIREITRTMTQAIQRVRERFKRDLIPREDMLEQIKGLRLDAVKQLQKLEQQVPGAFPPGLISAFAAQLKRVKKQLKDIRTISDKELKNATLQPADASKAEPAGQASLETGSIGESIPRRIQGIPNAERRIALLKRQTKGLSRLGKVGTRAFRRIGSNVGRTLGQILTLQKGVSGLGQVFQSVGASIVRSLQRVVSQLIQAVTTAAALRAAIAFIPGLNAIGGASSFSGLLSGVLGLADGGIVKKQTLAMIGEGGSDEAVVPLDGRLTDRIQTAMTNVQSMIQPATPSVQPAATSINTGGQMSLQGGAARLDGDRITVPISVVGDAVAQHNRIQRRVGRTGR